MVERINQRHYRYRYLKERETLIYIPVEKPHCLGFKLLRKQGLNTCTKVIWFLAPHITLPSFDDCEIHRMIFENILENNEQVVFQGFHLFQLCFQPAPRQILLFETHFNMLSANTLMLDLSKILLLGNSKFKASLKRVH